MKLFKNIKLDDDVWVNKPSSPYHKRGGIVSSVRKETLLLKMYKKNNVFLEDQETAKLMSKDVDGNFEISEFEEEELLMNKSEVVKNYQLTRKKMKKKMPKIFRMALYSALVIFVFKIIGPLADVIIALIGVIN